MSAKKKLTRAVKARATWNGYTVEWMAYGLRFPTSSLDEDCYIVPAAEYERLTKVDKLAGKLMQHANCLLKRHKCTEYEPIVLALMELASEPTARKK